VYGGGKKKKSKQRKASKEVRIAAYSPRVPAIAKTRSRYTKAMVGIFG